MRRVMLVLIAILLSGCADLPLLKPPPAPYIGLNKNSYGPLSTKEIVYCPYSTRRSDEQLSTEEIAASITGKIMSPIQGALKIDETIIKEDLQNKFKMPGDTGFPNVALLDRSREGIVFWYNEMIHPREVMEAATEFCKRENREVFPEGSSVQCGPAKKVCTGKKYSPLTDDCVPLPRVYINNQRATPDFIQHTYIISSFRCVASPTAPVTPSSEASRKSRKK